MERRGERDEPSVQSWEAAGLDSCLAFALFAHTLRVSRHFVWSGTVKMARFGAWFGVRGGRGGGVAHNQSFNHPARIHTSMFPSRVCCIPSGSHSTDK